jgi:hypothetical protein
METEKYLEYAVILNEKIAELFDKESDLQIDQKELMKGDNLTHFFHALANIVPTRFYNALTNDDKNNLEFNHLANHLCFQYLNQVKES